MRSPLLDQAGAVPAEGPDAGVAAHYGDPLREQRTLAESVGLVDRSHRDVVTVTGPDRLPWLHSITSQHLAELPAMTGIESLVLSPHGHVEHHLVLADDGERTWIDLEPGSGEGLLKYLESMRFLLRVEPAEVTDDWAVLSLVGPDTDAAVGELTGVALGPEPYAVAALPAGGLVRRMPWPGADAADLVVPRDQLPWLAAKGIRPAGVMAYDALRVEARRPRLGFETDHRTIPHEVGWLHTAVHLDKGCYRGQETVARVHNLGRPPRRLVLLHLDGVEETLPAPGADLTWNGTRVGFVGTAAQHFELGPVALALVKRTTPDDAELASSGVRAQLDRNPST